jgi:hypothetical protein
MGTSLVVLAATSQLRVSAISRTAASVRHRSAQRLRQFGRSHSREKKLRLNRVQISAVPTGSELPSARADTASVRPSRERRPDVGDLRHLGGADKLVATQFWSGQSHHAGGQVADVAMGGQRARSSRQRYGGTSTSVMDNSRARAASPSGSRSAEVTVTAAGTGRR